MGEFNIIEKYFLPLARGHKEVAGFQNDAAVLDISFGKQLVVTSDTLTAGTHFFDNQSAETIAKKALRTNLSDLAAMGSKPYCYQLCLSLPEPDEAWIEEFTNALKSDQLRYGIFLSGGDTTSTNGPLSISITAMGLVEEGKAVLRSGAEVGDLIFLTGSVGDAYCGLQSLRGEMTDVQKSCVEAYYVPEIPSDFGAQIGDLVSAGLDISDGLIADLGHIAKASSLTAVLELDSINFSAEVQTLIEGGQVTKEALLSGGDDYQLLLTVRSDKAEALEKIAKSCNVSLQQIGIMQEGEGEVLVLDENGLPIEFSHTGWQHF